MVYYNWKLDTELVREIHQLDLPPLQRQSRRGQLQ